MNNIKDVLVSKKRTITLLEVISRIPVEARFSKDHFKNFSDDEISIIISLLSVWGVVTTDNQNKSTYFLPSETAVLFIKSLTEILKQGHAIVPVWDDNAPVSSEINETNALNATNLLYLIEKRRVEGVEPQKITPIKKGTIVRAVIKRMFWGKEYVLMQYNSKICQYQLIGGIKCSGDRNNIMALRRKLSDELPELPYQYQDDLEFEQIYETSLEEQEKFPSKKFGVYVKYKTYLYCAVFSHPVDKSILKRIEKNRESFVTLKNTGFLRTEAGFCKILTC